MSLNPSAKFWSKVQKYLILEEMSCPNKWYLTNSSMRSRRAQTRDRPWDSTSAPAFLSQPYIFSKLKKFLQLYTFFYIIFLGSKIAIYYPQAFIMAAQATEAFSPQKRTYRTSKRENSLLFSIFMGHSPPPLDPDPATHYCGSMRIRIHNPDQYFIPRTYICSPGRCIKS